MSNSNTIPAQRILNGKAPVKQAFKRALHMQGMIAEAMMLAGMMRENALSAIGNYWSRGKGKGKQARRAKPPARWTRNQPHESTRQARPKYYTATVNGFEIMQRMPRQGQLAAQYGM